MRQTVVLLTVFLMLTSASIPARAALDADAIGSAAGAAATTAVDGVVRIGWSRDDVAVQVDGMPFRPQAGLGSWAAFKETPGGAMVMGDTVVAVEERIDEGGPDRHRMARQRDVSRCGVELDQEIQAERIGRRLVEDPLGTSALSVMQSAIDPVGVGA